MPSFDCSGQTVQTIEHEVEAADRTAAARLYYEHVKAWPEYVGEDVCMGACEVCSNAIFEDEEWTYTADSCSIHKRCLPEDMRDAKG